MRLLLRLGGWLLTPFLAWAASFFGALLGSLIASGLSNPYWGIGVTAAGGVIGGVTVIVLWLRLLRRSPSIRSALHVRPDGTPLELPLGEDTPRTTEPTPP